MQGIINNWSTKFWTKRFVSYAGSLCTNVHTVELSTGTRFIHVHVNHKQGWALVFIGHNTFYLPNARQGTHLPRSPQK
jgi:hypothetical protein